MCYFNLFLPIITVT